MRFIAAAYNTASRVARAVARRRLRLVGGVSKRTWMPRTEYLPSSL